MFNRPISISPPRQKTIVFTGGIDESLSNLEKKPGECYDLENYEEISGEYHGYRSTMGYEVIDGSTQAVTGYAWASDVPLVFDPTDSTVVDDTDREDRRLEIVTPTGADYLKGSFNLGDDIFAVSYESVLGTHQLWHMKKGSGTAWTEITTFPLIQEGAATDSGVNYHFGIGRMQLYPTIADGATPNDTIVVMCNGISPAMILYADDSTLGWGVTVILEANGPQYPYSGYAGPYLPSDPAIPTAEQAYPIRSSFFNQRLHLAFPTGALFVSHVGDPFIYDPVIYTAGVWWLGSEITDMLVTPSSLTVFMEEGIDTIRSSDPDIVTGFDEIKETFSDISGAYANTAQRILGRTIFCDDRGITTLETTDAFGDFNAANISKKVQKTYQRYKDQIAGTLVDRKYNQYVIYFRNGRGIVLTVEPNYRGDFETKGAAVFNLGTTLNTIWGYYKDSKRLLTKTTDSYLRMQHSNAMSFDGDDIVSKITTSFHNYGSSVNYKTFTRALFELTATKGQVFQMKPLFDYSAAGIPKSGIYVSDPQPDSGIWGTGVWGEFVWGGTGAVNQEYSYITGVGVNMAVQFVCSDKHHSPHVVHNMIVLFKMGAIKF